MGQVTGGSQTTNSQQAQSGSQSNAAAPDIGYLLQSLNSIISGAGNFSQFSQPQIQNLSNTLNAGNASGVETYQQQAGGVANPALLFKGLATQGQQSGMQATEGLQSVLGEQSLEALLGPLSTIGGLLSSNGSYNSQGNSASAGLQQPSLLQTLFGL